MAPPKKKRSDLSRTAKYYRDHPESLPKKRAKDKEINARPEQRKKRSELSTKRKRDKAAGKDIAGKDLSHTKDGLRYKDSSTNRGSRSDTPGDRRARGKRKGK